MLDIIKRFQKKVGAVGLYRACVFSFRLTFYRIFGGEYLPQIIMGREVFIREDSKFDYYVAHSCFSGEFDVLLDCIQYDDVHIVLDAGGFIGFSALALSELFPQARIFTIEPSDENFKLLKKNVGGRRNIYPIHGALVSKRLKETSCEKILADRGHGEWGFCITEGVIEKPTAFSGKLFTIEDFLDTYGIKSIDVMKIDIEGSEHELFIEASVWIDLVRLIFVELHPDINSDAQVIFDRACQGRITRACDGEKQISILKIASFT